MLMSTAEVIEMEVIMDYLGLSRMSLLMVDTCYSVILCLLFLKELQV